MAYNPYRTYCYLWWKYWLNTPGDIYNFLVRLWDYTPLLWEDRDFDYGYLLKLLRFKIKRMATYISQSKILDHSEDATIQLLEADRMLRNIEEDLDDEWSAHWNHCHYKNEFDCCYKAEHGSALTASHKRDERNWHKLWKHLDKHMRGWWD